MTLAGLMVDATGSRVALFTEVATWGHYHMWRLTHTIEAPTMLEGIGSSASTARSPAPAKANATA